MQYFVTRRGKSLGSFILPTSPQSSPQGSSKCSRYIDIKDAQALVAEKPLIHGIWSSHGVSAGSHIIHFNEPMLRPVNTKSHVNLGLKSTNFFDSHLFECANIFSWRNVGRNWNRNPNYLRYISDNLEILSNEAWFSLVYVEHTSVTQWIAGT